MQNYFETVEHPVITADFDYFRLAREKWELMLTRLTQAGVSHLILTIPWGFHEIVAGTADLTGSTQPRRNVTGLVDLCAALKFNCLLKLGPLHSDHGLLHRGLPSWLVRNEEQLEAALPEAVNR